MKSALVVIDTQNDFCSPNGICAKNGNDISKLKKIIVNLKTAVNRARQNEMEIIWVQYLGDDKYKKPNLIERDKKKKKKTKCLENTQGAEFYQVVPNKTERIIKKYACFDPFLNPEFEAYLKERKITHLILAGIYADVCLDSTARTGFQKGYNISVLRDCTESIHYDKENVLEFMKKFYNANIIKSDNFV